LQLLVRHGDWTVAGAQRRDVQGELVFDLRMGDFQDFQQTVLPTRIRFLMYGETEVDMSLDVDSVDVNVDLPDSLFELDPPRGVEQIPL
jgi:hypothetical protein